MNVMKKFCVMLDEIFQIPALSYFYVNEVIPLTISNLLSYDFYQNRFRKVFFSGKDGSNDSYIKSLKAGSLRRLFSRLRMKCARMCLILVIFLTIFVKITFYLEGRINPNFMIFHNRSTGIIDCISRSFRSRTFVDIFLIFFTLLFEFFVLSLILVSFGIGLWLSTVHVYLLNCYDIKKETIDGEEEYEGEVLKEEDVKSTRNDRKESTRENEIVGKEEHHEEEKATVNEDDESESEPEEFGVIQSDEGHCDLEKTPEIPGEKDGEEEEKTPFEKEEDDDDEIPEVEEEEEGEESFGEEKDQNNGHEENENVEEEHKGINNNGKIEPLVEYAPEQILRNRNNPYSPYRRRGLMNHRTPRKSKRQKRKWKNRQRQKSSRQVRSPRSPNRCRKGRKNELNDSFSLSNIIMPSFGIMGIFWSMLRWMGWASRNKVRVLLGLIKFGIVLLMVAVFVMLFLD